MKLIKAWTTATFIAAFAGVTPLANADVGLESEWIQALKSAWIDNGQSLPMNQYLDNDTFSIQKDSVSRLLNGRHKSDKRGWDRHIVSPVKYQADIKDNELTLKFFVRF